ncbi:MAG TPA: M23 family metallopeptidase, partial [Gammaproteobacteria bacterium]|nr:M23 family metallopeptidase [Gammaproteobacteria bacterium]
TLNRMKMHKGVDYAAKRGTPIKAAGDGRIVFRGRKGGYGRVIIIQHGGHYSTLYAHMSAFKKGLRVGSRVRQGQIIGFVGSSGRATGPHLHYEFRVNGVHRNPLTVKLPDAAPIRREYVQDFRLKTEGLLSQLDMHNRTRLALRQP